jgi:hypothetical protein
MEICSDMAIGLNKKQGAAISTAAPCDRFF